MRNARCTVLLTLSSPHAEQINYFVGGSNSRNQWHLGAAARNNHDQGHLRQVCESLYRLMQVLSSKYAVFVLAMNLKMLTHCIFHFQVCYMFGSFRHKIILCEGNKLLITEQNFRVNSPRGRKLWRYNPPKRRYMFASGRGVTFLKTSIFYS